MKTLKIWSATRAYSCFFPQFAKPPGKADQFLSLLKAKDPKVEGWAKENLKPEDGKQAVTAVLQFVLKDNTSADLKDTFALIRPCFAKLNIKGMVALLDQAQEFCEMEGERDSLKDILEVFSVLDLIPVDGFKEWAKANPEPNSRLGTWLDDKIEEEAAKLAELDEDDDEKDDEEADD